MIKAVGVVEEPLPLALRKVLGSLLTTVKHKCPAVATADQEEEPPQGKTYIYTFLTYIRAYIHIHSLSKDEVLPDLDRGSLAVGDMLDGYCVRTFKWYPAKIIALSGTGPLVLIYL